VTVKQERSLENRNDVEAAASRPAVLSVVLRALPIIAAFACVTMLFARALVPALHGWVVGLSVEIDVGDVLAAAMSQLLALVLVVTLAGLLLMLLRVRTPTVLRIAGVFLGVLSAFALFTTIGVARLPSLVHVVLAATACLAAMIFGADATRTGGLLGLVPATVGLASVLRTVGAYKAERALAERRDLTTMNEVFHSGQMLATAALGFLVVAVCVTLVGAFQIDRKRTGIGFAAALLLSVVTAWKVTTPVDDLEPAWGVLLRRFGQQLLTRPPALVDPLVPALLAVLLPAVALLAVSVYARKSSPAVAGALGLSLLAGASAEVPLLALGLIVGSIALSLDRRDPNGVLAAMTH